MVYVDDAQTGHVTAVQLANSECLRQLVVVDEEGWADSNEGSDEMHHVRLAELFGQGCHRPDPYTIPARAITPFSKKITPCLVD